MYFENKSYFEESKLVPQIPSKTKNKFNFIVIFSQEFPSIKHLLNQIHMNIEEGQSIFKTKYPGPSYSIPISRQNHISGKNTP